MENVMDFPGWGKSEAISHFGDLGDYLERSVSPWGEFGGDVAWKS